MLLVLLFHILLLNMFRMLVHPSSGAYDLLWVYFVCCIALVRCVLVLRCGSAGVVWYPDAGWSTTTISMSVCKETYDAHRDGVLGCDCFVSYWTVAVSDCIVSSTVSFRLFEAEDTCVCGAAESIHLATSPISWDGEPTFAAWTIRYRRSELCRVLVCLLLWL